MFILDGSGSTGRDYAPDTVVPTTNDVFGVRSPTDTFTCRTDSTGNNVCRRGEPPFNAGQFNGMAYNPNITYRAAVNGSTSAAIERWLNYDSRVRRSSSPGGAGTRNQGRSPCAARPVRHTNSRTPRSAA